MRRFLSLAATAAVLAVGSQAMAGPPYQEKGHIVIPGALPSSSPTVQNGLNYLKSKIGEMETGEAAFTALTLYKAEVPVNDPALVACLAKIGECFGQDNRYTPQMKDGANKYEAAVTLIALANIDYIGYKPQIEAVANYLINSQLGNGGWDYSHRTAGDTSMSQYALLGLWEADGAGVLIPPRVWDRAASWFLSVQTSGGSWNYHRDETQWPETISMSAAGVGSLYLCQGLLAKHRKGQDLMNPLMTPVDTNGEPLVSRYKVETAAASINSGIDRGIGWLQRSFQISKDPIMGQSPYYALYGMERMVALSRNDKVMGAMDWYGRGMQFVLSNQGGDGSWNAQHNQVPNTCWAVLFGVKATTISVKKIDLRKLAAGTQVGNRKLPANLENVQIGPGGRVSVKPMGGAIDGMLAALNDVKNSDSAIAGLEEKFQKEGPKILRPYKDRFRKMLSEPNGDQRVVAAWGLGRMADLDAAPVLIKALLDSDDGVVTAARVGLEVLSRKLEGFGPAPGANAAERLAAAKRWQQWFETVKPPDLDAPDLVLEKPGTPAAPAAPAATPGQN